MRRTFALLLFIGILHHPMLLSAQETAAQDHNRPVEKKSVENMGPMEKTRLLIDEMIADVKEVFCNLTGSGKGQ